MSSERPGPLGWLRRLVRTPELSLAPTALIPVVDDAFVVRVLDLAIRIGETMLAVGAPASEVTSAIIRVGHAYGVTPVHVDVTYNSITVAHHRSGADSPVSLLRVLEGSAPDHEKLQRLQTLVGDIADGLNPDAALTRARAIRRIPFRYRPAAVIVAQAMLAVGVAVMYGANPLMIALSFVAAALAASTQHVLARARVPFFFSQIAGGFVLTVAAGLALLLRESAIPGAEDIRASVIVASGIVLMLAGLTVVGAAQDAIDGFALTAGGRILELVTQTLGVVIGILAGLETMRVVGLGIAAPTSALPFGSVPLQFVGAVVIAIAVAVYNGGGIRIVGVSAALSLVAWTGFLAASAAGFDTAAASGVGAFFGSFAGVLIAYRLHVPSVAITTAAILPMVPGAAVFRGLLGVVETGEDAAVLLTGASTLAGAATVGIALAIGATLGLYVGRPVRTTIGTVARARARLRR
ncbi:threonine/serine exporter ThrE family protein [Microbacterium sp. NPDC091313]